MRDRDGRLCWLERLLLDIYETGATTLGCLWSSAVILFCLVIWAGLAAVAIWIGYVVLTFLLRLNGIHDIRVYFAS